MTDRPTLGQQWRVGGRIHVYEGERPVATFLREDDAESCVADHNVAREAVLEFAWKVQHGDEKHREWLLAAARAWVDGRPLPECDQK
jgi:hypothetical protein